MTNLIIQEWLRTGSIVISLISSAVVLWIGILNYRLRVLSEIRSQDSSRAEIDVKISKLFTELMWIAHGRAGSEISEKFIEEMFEKELIVGKNAEEVNKEIKDTCILNLPVGLASQEAAIISLGVLGNRYEILKESARIALESLRKHLVDRSDQSDMAIEVREVIKQAQLILER